MSGIVIIGAGQAGAQAALRLRARGHAGPITLIGAEPVLPYQRPPLSKAYLLGEMTLERMLLRPAQVYADQGIALSVGTRVDAIDPVARVVQTGTGPLPYDALILATGATPRPLPAAIGGTLAGVHVIRSLADADGLAADLVPGMRVLVVGGGYVGLEAAAVLRKLGHPVTLIEAAPRILGRVACAETADAVRALHRAHGVDLREGVGLDHLTATAGRVSGAVLADGSTLGVDLVIVGIGVTPATDLARSAGCALDNGIATDAQGQSSVAGIWAAGDCASFPQGDGRIRLESVQNAIDMADCVADNILGAGRAYAPLPWFWSDQYDLKLQIAGLNTGADRVVVRPGPQPSHWYFAGGRLVSVDSLGDARAYMVGKRLLEAGQSPDPARLADPACDLKTLLRA